MPKDLGTWAFILSLLTLILMYPAGLLINLTTPLVANWLAKWSRSSLEKRISKLENKLAELEKNPAIDPVQNEMLWAIKSVKIVAINVGTGIFLVIYCGVRSVVNPDTPSFKEFSGLVLFMVFVNVVQVLVMRYQRDFRWVRSPSYRKGLKTTIEGLKKIRDDWNSEHPNAEGH